MSILKPTKTLRRPCETKVGLPKWSKITQSSRTSQFQKPLPPIMSAKQRAIAVRARQLAATARFGQFTEAAAYLSGTAEGGCATACPSRLTVRMFDEPGKQPASSAALNCFGGLPAHSTSEGDRPTVHSAAAALAITISRGGPRRPWRIPRISAALSSGPETSMVSCPAGSRPKSAGCHWNRCKRPPAASITSVVPPRVISSRPSAPCTSKARWTPSKSRASANSGCSSARPRRAIGRGPRPDSPTGQGC